MKDKILEWTKDCEYLATEDYAYGKSGALGQIFSLAEFEGNIKLKWIELGKKMRLYSVNSNKKFFSIIRIIPKYIPHIIKFHAAPCQNPVKNHTINIFLICLSAPNLFPPNGIYT